MQDIFAVVFIAASEGQVPTGWVFGLLILPFARPLLLKIMQRSGHGEVLVLFGIVYALIVSEAFEFVHLKGDLGALVAGAVVAGHPKSEELSKSLLGFKDLLLVAFFLTVGMAGSPTLATVAVAGVLILALPLKACLFFLIFTRFKLRSRTSLLGSLSLANYSEFGLIVMALGASAGWVSGDWVLVVAVAVGISFALASPLNFAADKLWGRFEQPLMKFQTKSRLPDDEPIDLSAAEIVVIGMGRLGTAAFDRVRDRGGAAVVGIDYDKKAVTQHQAEGRDVLLADATEPDVWRDSRLDRLHSVLITVPDLNAKVYLARQLVSLGVYTAAVVEYDDQIPLLEKEGVNAVFNYYADAGSGFAEHALEMRPSATSE